jgi:putative aldouronate transport system permease protein
MKQNTNKLKKVGNGFNILAYSVCILVAAICVIPFIMIISGSFSDNGRITVEGYGLLPKGFSLMAYNTIIKSAHNIIQAYKITIIITLSGTVLGYFITSMAGYVLSRKDFAHRNFFAMFFYFTSIFTGGMIPTFLVVSKYLGLKDTIWALILPGLTNMFYIFLFRNYINGIPDALIESAKIDGAGDFTTYLKIILPISKPATATIALFIALAYWNDWYRSSIYITNTDLYSLQYLLYKMLLSVSDALKQASSDGGIIITNLPTETLKLATAVIATGPVLLFYPFAQKYFVGGLTIGSVKG